MNSSKRQTTPWTKSRKNPRPKKKEKGEHFDEGKKKELAASDKGSWFDQSSSDVSGVSGVSHPSTSGEVGATRLKLMASKAFISSLEWLPVRVENRKFSPYEHQDYRCKLHSYFHFLVFKSVSLPGIFTRSPCH